MNQRKSLRNKLPADTSNKEKAHKGNKERNEHVI